MLVAAVAMTASGCAEQAKQPIRIGVLSVCRGAFAPFYDGTLAGAEVALVRRGGHPAGRSPDQGVRGVRIGGRDVELLFGCSDDSGERALGEARRLVEEEKVDALVGPATSAGGSAIRDYARTQPHVAFVNGSSPALEVTMARPAANVFRFNTNAVQWTAGLGTYAYRTLGWRRAVVIGSDFAYSYDESAGFIAEFCALGGHVTRRIWVPFGETHPARYAARIPPGTDGHFLSFVLPQDLLRFYRSAPSLRGALGGKVLLGAAAVQAAGSGGLGSPSVGVVIGAAMPLGSSSRPWVRFLNDFRKAFPNVPFNLIAPFYFDAMEATLRGLEEVDGDLSDRQRFLAALAKTTFNGPGGNVELDRLRQAIAPNYLVQVQKRDNALALRMIRTIERVDDTYGGRFGPGKPLPSRTSPPCKRGKPPPWAR
jgi:branched-chain amino acid transport system substrate-binding protein